MDVGARSSLGRRHSASGPIVVMLLLSVAACGSSAPSAPRESAPTPAVAAITAAPPSPTPTAPVALTPIPLPDTTPAPFGQAGNGRLVYVDDGRVTWFEPDTGASGVLYAGAPDHASVMPSRDGTKLALISESARGHRQLTVLGVDGHGIRTIPGTWSDDAEFDWSPDGRAIAIASDDTGIAKLTIAPVDGSMPSTYDLPVDARHPWYLPDGRLVFKGTRETSAGQRFALYLFDPASGVATPINAESTELMDIIDAKPSADGTTLVYHRWREPDEVGRIRLIDVATGDDTALAVDEPDQEFSDLLPRFSPDGSQVMFVRFLAGGNQLMLVPATGGAPRAIGELTPGNDAPTAAFSPDGRSILARFHNGHLWRLPRGIGENRQLDLDVAELPAWLRVAG